MDKPTTAQLLASVTNITAIIIANGETTCNSAGPNGEGMYSGWILDYDGRALLSTIPCYDSEQEAEIEMQLLKDELRRLKLGSTAPSAPKPV